MTETKEDTAPPASIPQDETSRSCTRQTQCKQANCPGCSTPIIGNNHVRDLSQKMNTTPPPKRLTKPPAPPDHIISSISEDFQQAFIDNELDQIQDLLEAYKLHVVPHPDYLKFNLSELNKHLKTARNLTKPPPTPASSST